MDRAISPVPSRKAGHLRHSILDGSILSKYLAVLVSTEATSKEEAAGLVAYMHQVVRLSRGRGFKWLKYDTEFRDWAAAKQIQMWGKMNM